MRRIRVYFLHALDVHIDAALAELVQTAAR